MAEIRAARPDDRDTIVAFNRALAEESEGLGLDATQLRRGVEAVLGDPGKGRYWLAAEGEAVIGQLMVTLEWSDWRCGWFWWIQSVYVRPDRRGRGVYRKLHDHVLAEARSRDDVCGIRLYVDVDNRAARRVYDRTGMKPARYEMRELDFRRPAQADRA